MTTLTEGIRDLAHNPQPIGKIEENLPSDNLLENNMFMFIAGILMGFIAANVALSLIITKLGKGD